MMINKLKKYAISGMISSMALVSCIPATVAFAAEPGSAATLQVQHTDASDLLTSSIVFKRGQEVYSQPFINFLSNKFKVTKSNAIYTAMDGFYALMSDKTVLEDYIGLINQIMAKEHHNEVMFVMNDSVNGTYSSATFVYQIGNEAKKYLEDELVYHAQGIKNGDIVVDLDSVVLDKVYVANDSRVTCVKLLGSYETDYHTSSSARCKNIELAAANFNETLMAPGETISVSNIFKPRTIQNGYQVAGIFVNGQKSTGVGGGICQVSTTIYCASLQAGVSVVERHSHSLPVAYVPKGMDATISAPYLDLKLRNDFDTAILYRTRTQNKKVAVDVYKVI